MSPEETFILIGFSLGRCVKDGQTPALCLLGADAESGLVLATGIPLSSSPVIRKGISHWLDKVPIGRMSAPGVAVVAKFPETP